MFTADWEKLLQLSKTKPLEGVVLTLSPLEPSDTILVTGLEKTTPDLLLRYIIVNFLDEDDSVTSVMRLSPTQALVSFKSQQSTFS